jgi:chromosome segregation ATPase
MIMPVTTPTAKKHKPTKAALKAELKFDREEILRLKGALSLSQGELEACHLVFQKTQPVLKSLRDEVAEFKSQVAQQEAIIDEFKIQLNRSDTRVHELEIELETVVPRLATVRKAVKIVMEELDKILGPTETDKKIMDAREHATTKEQKAAAN